MQAVAIDPARLTRASPSSTVAALKEECRARGLKISGGKPELLDRLRAGSILVSALPEYRVVDAVFKMIKQEAAAEDSAEIAEKLRIQEAKQKAARRIQEERQLAEDRRLATHTIRGSSHSCLMAPTTSLAMSASCGRAEVAHCSRCGGLPCSLSCERCDFDVCAACEATAVKEAAAKELKEAKELKAAAKRDAKRKREAEAEWADLPVAVRDPGTAQRDRRAPLGYSVWSSCGYGNDGWHSYNPPPRKEFDSSYATAADANARARYLFFARNPWGIDLRGRNKPSISSGPGMRNGSEEIQERVDGAGLVRLRVHPDDSEIWTVGVVPSAAFEHMVTADDDGNHDNDEDNGDYYDDEDTNDEGVDEEDEEGDVEY